MQCIYTLKSKSETGFSFAKSIMPLECTVPVKRAQCTRWHVRVDRVHATVQNVWKSVQSRRTGKSLLCSW